MLQVSRIALTLAITTLAAAPAEAQTASPTTTYWTEVTLGATTCPDVTIKPGPTEIARLPGDSLSVSHAGQTYVGKITREGNFTTAPKELVFGSTVYTIGITGLLQEKTLTAVVTVSVREQGRAECRYAVNWIGRN